MDDKNAAKFPATDNAVIWAEEFCRKFNGCQVTLNASPASGYRYVDQNTMLAWFGTAIEIGRTMGWKTAYKDQPNEYGNVIDYGPQFGEEE